MISRCIYPTLSPNHLKSQGPFAALFLPWPPTALLLIQLYIFFLFLQMYFEEEEPWLPQRREMIRYSIYVSLSRQGAAVAPVTRLATQLRFALPSVHVALLSFPLLSSPFHFLSFPTETVLRQEETGTGGAIRDSGTFLIFNDLR